MGRKSRLKKKGDLVLGHFQHLGIEEIRRKNKETVGVCW